MGIYPRFLRPIGGTGAPPSGGVGPIATRLGHTRLRVGHGLRVPGGGAGRGADTAAGCPLGRRRGGPAVAAAALPPRDSGRALPRPRGAHCRAHRRPVRAAHPGSEHADSDFGVWAILSSGSTLG
eukprot:4636823-Pyramimonas_sp.AAC.1